MKLLFDENLSSKLSNRLNDLFPNSLHVRDVGMKVTIDPIVWDYAKDNDLVDFPRSRWSYSRFFKCSILAWTAQQTRDIEFSQ